MFVTSAGRLSTAVLAECVRLATAAPSLHNSQPWRFRIRHGAVDVFVDRSRQLTVIDPSGREMLVSLGAAIFNLRVAIRNELRVPLLDLRPDPTEPDLVARVTPGPLVLPDPAVAALVTAIPQRHTNRRPFARTVIPADVLDRLSAAARSEGADLTVAGPVARGAILSLVRTAEQRLTAQGVYHAELTAWTVAAHTGRDGIPPSAWGPCDARQALPLRDFGVTLPSLQRPVEPFEPFPTLVILSTGADTHTDWLRAGQALQHVLLVATIDRLAATPITQPLEISALRTLLSDTGTRWAQMILRLGYGQPTTPTPRRPLSEILVPPTEPEPRLAATASAGSRWGSASV